ncbi:hypothetical protein GGQ21_002613 [Salinibacter ruber]|jgi:hypothetical protein|uniref:Uncharacterized protein n=2 Tax=Salinibacter ruber TaxID=146919 RepID=A0A9X2U4B9_9BACT|nr:hypothetical protein [Salinibacter ruber]MCS3628510.1 hypothetical protein [Salinibacter ruber]MCS3632429.1 hypothetical protein [Salinibacter ruber]MCS3671943.1 hypothetical protein [Salinibacter ruber]MCS3704997.1 hypothetical protein [Salinibacter ruber]
MILTTHAMKQIKAYVRPALVDHVIDMIEDQSADSPGVAASEVRVYEHPEDTNPIHLTRSFLDLPPSLFSCLLPKRMG